MIHAQIGVEKAKNGSERALKGQKQSLKCSCSASTAFCEKTSKGPCMPYLQLLK